jgi:hypothetical protein
LSELTAGLVSAKWLANSYGPKTIAKIAKRSSLRREQRMKWEIPVKAIFGEPENRFSRTREAPRTYGWEKIKLPSVRISMPSLSSLPGTKAFS